jgi:undecaprenyl-diphosphatase
MVASVAFGLFAIGVVLGITDNLDALSRSSINSLATPNLTLVAKALSFIGSVGVLFPLAALTGGGLWIARRGRDAALLIMVMLIAAVVNPTIKMSFARARPQTFFGDLPSSFSFASGHALFSACFFSIVAGIAAAHSSKVYSRALLWVVTWILVLAIGLSRIYLGVHYPTDVFAGFALAALIICVARGIMGHFLPGP